MKKVLLLFICILFFSTKTNAQQGRFYFNVSVGTGYNNYPQQVQYCPQQQQVYIREIRSSYYNCNGQLVNREDPRMVYKTIMNIDNCGRVISSTRLNVVNRYYNNYRAVIVYNNNSQEIF